MLAVEETDEEGQARWMLCGQATGRKLGALLPYEKRLLEAVTDGGQRAALESLTARMPDVLDSVRQSIVHDAISHGWLHRFRHDQRTEAGDQMALRIRSFQRDLRKFATGLGQAGLNGRLLPYALHFGMIQGDQLPLARFPHSWVAAFAGLPGWHQPPAARPGFGESDAVSKPSIDEQIMDLNVGAMLWLTGGAI